MTWTPKVISVMNSKAKGKKIALAKILHFSVLVRASTEFATKTMTIIILETMVPRIRDSKSVKMLTRAS